MRTILLLATALLQACGPTADQMLAHRIVCENYGYPPGSPAVAACIEREDNSYLPGPLKQPAP